MDDYSTEVNMNDDVEDDVWTGEETISFSGVPEQLWSDDLIDQPPADPSPEVDSLADRVEMRDWRLKDFGEGPEMKKRWMRRSRFVAREFANTRQFSGDGFPRRQRCLFAGGTG